MPVTVVGVVEIMSALMLMAPHLLGLVMKLLPLTVPFRTIWS